MLAKLNGQKLRLIALQEIITMLSLSKDRGSFDDLVVELYDLAVNDDKVSHFTQFLIQLLSPDSGAVPTSKLIGDIVSSLERIISHDIKLINDQVESFNIVLSASSDKLESILNIEVWKSIYGDDETYMLRGELYGKPISMSVALGESGYMIKGLDVNYKRIEPDSFIDLYNRAIDAMPSLAVSLS